ncbi:MAG: hypothetical protein OEY22_10305 [Candidatus Bathyarchaeota archaeon]|nr:hypothetical protein [Candidatus Bathyarchaeota archaeon]
MLKLKLKALRRGVWFKALSRIDRALFNLTIKIVHGVRSFALAKTVFTVVRKLEDALENRFLNTIKEAGFLLARKLSFFAQKWGNDSARAWAFDKSFVKFLAIMHLNNPRAFKP